MGQDVTFEATPGNFLRVLRQTASSDPQMNVLFVQPALPRYRVPFFAELQRRAATRVEVWSDHHHPLFPYHDPGDAFRSVHCPETQVGPFISQPAILRAIRDPWPDVVVLSWNTRYMQLSAALGEARLRGCPVVLWGHGYSKQFSYLKHQTRNFLGRLARACVTYSDLTRARLIEEGLEASKTFCAPNALDGAPIQQQRTYWQQHPDALERLQKGFGITPGKVVLFVSRLEPDKRVSLLLQATQRVAPKVANLQVLIVGGGSELPGLKKQCQRLGISDRILFLGPIYDEHVLGGLFASATAFVYPVAVGLSILHALNYGVPVITSDNPECHNPEFDALTPGRNSLLYRHDEVEDLAEQIERLVCNPDLHARLAEGALSSVAGPNGRSLARMADGMLEALNFAVAATSQRADRTSRSPD